MASAEAMIAELARRITALERRQGVHFSLGRTRLAPDDSGPVLTVQSDLDPLSTRDAVPMLFHYGFGSLPPVGTDVHIAHLGGDRSKAVIIASGHQTTRLRGKAVGDAWMAGHGWSIVINGTGIAIVGDVTVTGDVKVSGEVTAKTPGGTFVTLSQHKHPANGSPPTPGT